MPNVHEPLRTNRLQLAAESVDSNTGVIRRCTVLKSGVPALGKILLLDSKGNITRDPKLAVKELPIYTDDATLTTLLAAAKAAGGRVKSREDHVDTISARAGYSDAFGIEGDRVYCDLHLFRSYQNRDKVLEAADKTPDEIGLSIDFVPTYELLADRALMRVEQLVAVDIVDEGAVTPDGLLLSAAVDSKTKVTNNADPAPSQPSPKMPETNTPAAPSLSDAMAAIQQCMATLSEMGKTLTAHGEMLAKFAPQAPAGGTPPAKPGTPAPTAKNDAGDNDGDEYKKGIATITEQLSSLQKTVGDLRRERALLGFRGTEADRAKLANAGADEIEKMSAAAKTYTELVADARKADSKLSAAAAHAKVQRESPDAYRLHLSSKGVTKTQA